MLFFALMLFMIVIFVQPQEFIPAVMGMPLVQYIMGFTTIAWIVSVIHRYKARIFDSHQNIMMLVFWIAIVISTFFVHWKQYTFDIFIEWGKFVVIYFLIVNIVNSRKRLQIITWIIVLSMAVTAYIGIMQYFGVDYTGIGIGREGRIRGVGIFDTNQLAYTLAFISPMICGLIFVTKNLLKRWILFLIFMTYYYAIFLTGSRGGMLCAVAVLGLLFIIFNRNHLVKMFGTGIAGVLFVIFLKLSARLQTIGEGVDTSVQARFNVWGEALMRLKYYPLFGVGKGMWADHFSMSPHSSYVQALTELGLVGLFCWLGLFYFTFKNLKAIENTEQTGSKDNSRDGVSARWQVVMAKIFQLTFIVYLMASFFSGNAYYITLYILFALAVVLQYVSSLEQFKKQRPRFTFTDIRNIALFEAAIILLIHFVS